jgi:polyphosphate kinase 2 (PPK2 family)
MLELVNLDLNVPKDTYQQVFPPLQVQLGACQRAARAANVPVLIVFEGWDAAGKGSLINGLSHSLDPRGFKVHSTGPANDVEKYYPWMWRFHKTLPGGGDFALFDRSWYGRVLGERIAGAVSHSQWRQAYEDIEQFERQLTEAGYVIVKFWLQLGKAEQRRRFKRLAKDPATAWRVGKAERQQHRHYRDWLPAVEEMLQRTNTAYAPWTIVEATHGRHARVKVFETVLQTVQRELERRQRQPQVKPQPMPDNPPPAPRGNILERADLSLAVERPQYVVELARLQRRLFQLEHELYLARIPAVIMYEGWDAAGKGGNIRRLTQGLDPRGYEVVPIAAPTAEEKAHHYLWRFWKSIPKAGHITIFDRSWYGRVLVERVEGFCSEEEWRRAFREINEFERQLASFGTVIVKFWLHIDQEEQLRRFESRKELQDKQWKITDEDWRNRAKWKQYELAIVDALQQTSTTYAPWTILEANCKLYGRIKALRTVADALEQVLAGA